MLRNARDECPRPIAHAVTTAPAYVLGFMVRDRDAFGLSMTVISESLWLPSNSMKSPPTNDHPCAISAARLSNGIWTSSSGWFSSSTGEVLPDAVDQVVDALDLRVTVTGEVICGRALLLPSAIFQLAQEVLILPTFEGDVRNVALVVIEDELNSLPDRAFTLGSHIALRLKFSGRLMSRLLLVCSQIPLNNALCKQIPPVLFLRV